MGFELALRVRERIRSLTILNTMVELPKGFFPGEMLASISSGGGKDLPFGLNRVVASPWVWQQMLYRVGVWDRAAISMPEILAWRNLALGSNNGASYLQIMSKVRKGHDSSRWAEVIDSRQTPYPVAVAWGGHDPILSLRQLRVEGPGKDARTVPHGAARAPLSPGGLRPGGRSAHSGERGQGMIEVLAGRQIIAAPAPAAAVVIRPCERYSVNHFPCTKVGDAGCYCGELGSPPTLLGFSTIKHADGVDIGGVTCVEVSSSLAALTFSRSSTQLAPTPFAQAPFRIHSDARPSSVM